MAGWEAIAAQRPPIGDDEEIAVTLWQAMGGMDWAALPVLLQVYDVADPATVIELLLVIRDEMNKPKTEPGAADDGR